jgi:putative redox protein
VAELSTRSVSSSWQPGPLRCEVAAGPFTIPVDEPVSEGGTGAAPQPTDLLLAAAASCFTLAVVHSAAKRAIVLQSLRVDVTGHYAGNRFDAMHLSVDAVGPSADELAKLLKAAQRVCYVTNTLRMAVRIDVASRPTQ